MQNLKDLELLIKSASPLIIIESWEEGRVRDLFQILANNIFKPFYCWTITEGLKCQYPATSSSRHQQGNKPPYQSLKMVEFDYPPAGAGSDSRHHRLE